MIKDLVDLNSLSVLLTRPAGRGAELRAALEAAGARVWEQPLMRIAPLSPAQHGEEIARCRSRIMDLDNYQRLVFISVNAVEYGLELIDQFWPQWPLGVAVYAIGEATARALARGGIDARCGGNSMTSEALLALDELQSLEHEKVLVVRGLGGRETLAETLRARGAQVAYAQCYQRQPEPLEDGQLRALLVKQQLDVVCLNSGETLEYFFRHCRPEACPAGLALLLPSGRVRERARALGYSRTIQADNAGTAATLAALRQMREDNERR